KEITAVTFSPDGKLIVATDSGGAVRFLDRESGKYVRTIQQTEGGFSASFSQDVHLLLTGGGEGTILWEATTGKRLRTFTDIRRTSDYVALSPDGKLALAGGRAFGGSSEEREDLRWVKLWDVSRGRLLNSWQLEGIVTCVAFSADGKLALAGSMGGDIKVWRVADRGECCAFRQECAIRSACFNPSGRYVLIGSESPGDSRKSFVRPRLWEVATGKPALEVDESDPDAWWDRAALSPDGKRILGAGGSWRTLWDVR